MREGLRHNIIDQVKENNKGIFDFSFKSNDLPEFIRSEILTEDMKSFNKTILLEQDKKIQESKKKINDKDKNILDHLSVLQKFRLG